jgi:hypothetical protein
MFIILLHSLLGERKTVAKVIERVEARHKVKEDEKGKQRCG